MNRRLVIRIHKPTQAESLMWVILAMPFLFGFIINLLGIPSMIKYLCDIAWVWLLILLILYYRTNTREQPVLGAYIICFLIYTLLGYIVNFQSPLYYLWGVRNNFRMYVVFVAVTVFAKPHMREQFLRFFDRVFWLNAAVCLIQFFVFEKEQDYLGGIFGVERGGNAYLNNYFVIVTAKALLNYLNGEIKLTDCVMKCGTMLLIAALAELRFYYVEFVVILVMAVLLTQFSWKKVLIIAGGMIGIALATRLLVILFPEFEGTFTLHAMYEIASTDKGYTSQGDINRLNAISVISERFLKTWPKQVVGMGLGNADTSGFSFLTTPFYTRYSALNYSWFSLAFLFLETGFIGLVFYFGFFLLVYLRAKKQNKNAQNRFYCQMAMICAVCCVGITVYNSSLRTEAGYMMYCILALPFIKESPASKPDRQLTLYGKDV